MARPPTLRALVWLAVVVVLAAVVVIVAALLRPRGVAAEVASARVGTLLVEVQCDGTLEPPPGGELRPQESGFVTVRAVGEGERVRRGDLLLRLAAPDLEAQAREAQAERLQLEAEATAATAATETARRELEHWEDRVAADRRLVQRGALTAAALRDDERSLAGAREQDTTARDRLATLRGPGSRLQLAQESAAALAQRVASLDIRAPADGVVYGLPEREGERVEAGDLVACVTDPDHPRARLRVDQPDLPRIALGQRLVVTFSGLQDRQWSGRVVSVAQALRPSGDRQVGEVVGELSDPAHALPLNASVDVRIVVAETPSALSVPRAALYRQGEHRFVYVLRDGRTRRRDVTVGLIGLTDVQITSGLEPGEEVVLAGEVPLSEGLRVAPVR